MSLRESIRGAKLLHVGATEAVATVTDDLAAVEPVSPAEIANHSNADCLLCEHRPPARDARDLLSTVRKWTPDLPVVVVADEDVPELLDAGATDCVRPDCPELLSRRLSVAIGGSNAGDDPGRGGVGSNAASQSSAIHEHHRDLIEACPDALFVADAETGIILDVNPAAEELLGAPREEIRGRHQSSIHPPEREAYYRHIFDDHVERGGVTRRDGGLTVLRDDGTEVPVEVSANVTELGDREVIYGVFRDVTERRERERTLSSLRTATRELMAAESADEIADVAVETVRDALELPMAGVHLLDASEDVLRPVAVTAEAGVSLENLPAFEAGEALAWHVFEGGEATVFSDVSENGGVYDGDAPVEAEMILPLGDHGVLVVGGPSAADFPDYALDFAELLAANVQTALDRARREETVAAQRSELAELNRINAVIRDLDRTLVRATTREEIRRSVVERLADDGPYRFAWVGERTPDGFEATESVGDADLVVAGATDAVESSQTPCGLAVDALAADEVVVADGDPSLVAIPLRYRGRDFGVLVVADRDSAFDERERTVLAELGETIAHATAAVDSRRALVSGSAMVELEFDMRDTDNCLVESAAAMSCEFATEGTTLGADGTLLYYLTASGAPVDSMVEQLRSYDVVEHVRVVTERDDDCLLELARADASLVMSLADYGGAIRSGIASEADAHLAVEVPADVDVRGAVEAFHHCYPNAELVAQRGRDRTARAVRRVSGALADDLTDRQRSALEAAHFAGYFEWPRASTGEEVAESLGVTSPTFHQHLRRSQSKLLEAFFAD